MASQANALDARATQLRMTSDALRSKMTDSLNLVASGIPTLQNHSVKEDYVMTALSPEDFAKEATTAPLDFNKLKSEFIIICTDYSDNKTFEGKYLAVDFCKKMLYEVGPKSREVRRRQGTGSTPSVTSTVSSQPKVRYQKTLGVVQQAKPIIKCACCPNSHNLYHCPVFKSETVAKRMLLARQANACIHCLGRHIGQCNTVYSCRK